MGSIHEVLISPYTWGFVALVALAFTAAGKFSATAATVFLWIAWVAAVFGIYRSSPVLQLDTGLRILVMIAVGSILAIGTLMLSRWLASPRPDAGRTSTSQHQRMSESSPALSSVLSPAATTASKRIRFDNPQESDKSQSSEAEGTRRSSSAPPLPAPSAPPSLTSTEQYGNLRERAYALSREVINDLWTHGWPVRPSKRIGAEPPPERFQIVPMPGPKDDQRPWLRGRTLFFMSRRFRDLQSIRDEFAQHNWRNARLDDYINDIETRTPLNPRNADSGEQYLLPQEIEDIADQLRSLTESSEDARARRLRICDTLKQFAIRGDMLEQPMSSLAEPLRDGETGKLIDPTDKLNEMSLRVQQYDSDLAAWVQRNLGDVYVARLMVRTRRVAYPTGFEGTPYARSWDNITSDRAMVAEFLKELCSL